MNKSPICLNSVVPLGILMSEWNPNACQLEEIGKDRLGAMFDWVETLKKKRWLERFK